MLWFTPQIQGWIEAINITRAQMLFANWIWKKKREQNGLNHQQLAFRSRISLFLYRIEIGKNWKLFISQSFSPHLFHQFFSHHTNAKFHLIFWANVCFFSSCKILFDGGKIAFRKRKQQLMVSAQRWNCVVGKI